MDQLEKEEVDEVETQVVFLVSHASFSSFYMPQLDQIGANPCYHGPLTSPELHTSACDLYEFGRSWIPIFGYEGSLSCQLLVGL
ncbi:hypothetical protein Tco_1015023 [Tanacetum coccineum]